MEELGFKPKPIFLVCAAHRWALPFAREICDLAEGPVLASRHRPNHNLGGIT